jgi:hypothetical protein
MPPRENPIDIGIPWKPPMPTKKCVLERFNSDLDYSCEFGSTSFQRLDKQQTPGKNSGESEIWQVLPAESLLLWWTGLMGLAPKMGLDKSRNCNYIGYRRLTKFIYLCQPVAGLQ